MALLNLVLLIACSLVLLTVAWMGLQVACGRPGPSPAPASVSPSGSTSSTARPRTRPSLAVLVPAHNEAVGLAATLRAIQCQLQPPDRLLVVADNCTDNTADVARALGAEVVERHDALLRGKGHALACGFAQLEAAPRAVLVVVDADCLLAPGALDSLALQVQATRRPAQALYLMRNAPGAALRERYSEFAWRIKNWLRPLGLLRLSLPCQLMGSGMAFPWPLLRDHSLASGHLVEDMQLGLHLAQAGSAALFCPRALVTSTFPVAAAAQQHQRTRWEHGHLALITQALPSALRAWATRPTREALALALDLAIPPLSLLAALCIALLGLSALAWALDQGAVPFGLATAACAGFAGAVALAWHRVGRGLLSGADLARMGTYVLWKLPLYLRFLTHRQLAWVRSQRHEKEH